jgi:heptosyltransferase-3
LKILLIHCSGRVGDSLLATPAICNIQKKFPNANIELLAHRNRIDLFKNTPNINLLGAISEKRAWYKGWLNLKKYDYVIVFNYDNPLKNIIKFALRVGNQVIASDVHDDKIDSKLHISIPRLPNQHHIHLYNHYLSPFNFKKKCTRIKLYITTDEIKFAKSLLYQHKLLKSKFLVGYQIVSFPTRSYRDWPIDNFLSLAYKILEIKPNAFFIIFGSMDDRSKLTNFIKRMPKDSYLDLTGLSLRKTAAVMSLIDLYVGVDTGPSHMMSAFDVPMLTMYHGKFPSKYYAPMGHPYSIAMDHPKKDKCSEIDSMADISVNNVFSKLKKFLKNE